MGPNVRFCSSQDKNEQVFHGVNDVATASATLDIGAKVKTHDLLMAAVQLMGQSSGCSVQKKMKVLDSIVDTLQRNEDLSKSTAFAHALVLRADAKLELIPSDTISALRDAYKAVEIDHIHGKAWRIIADAEEKCGNTIGAIDAITKWAECNPSFASKAKVEIGRLSS